MGDPFSIAQSILDLVTKITATTSTLISSNRDRCHRIINLVRSVGNAVRAQKLKRKFKEDKDMSVALKGLEGTLQRSLNVLVDCRCLEKNVLTQKLDGVHQNISKDLHLVQNLGLTYQFRNSVPVIPSTAATTHRPQGHGLGSTRTNGLSTNKLASDQNKTKMETKKTCVASSSSRGLQVKNQKGKAPAGSNLARGPLSNGSAKPAPVKRVIGQGGPSNVNKDASHTSIPIYVAGSTKKNVNGIKKIDGPNSRLEVKTVKNNVQPKNKGADAPNGSAKPTLVKGVKGQGRPSIANKITSIPTEDMTSVTSIDVHTAKPWIVTGHKGGYASIWNYQKQKIVTKLQVNQVPEGMVERLLLDTIPLFSEMKAAPYWVCSAKFIAEKMWLVAGDGGGNIHVYRYSNTDDNKHTKVTTIVRAHEDKSVDSLAVHPTEPYILSSSNFGRTIKLWDWSSSSRDWKKIREFDMEPTTYGVLSLKFNPWDTDTFACVTDKNLKVGNIKSSSITTTLDMYKAADYFFTTRGVQHLMVTLRSTSPDAEILDTETGEVAHALGLSGRKTRLVAGHPTLPIIVTAFDADDDGSGTVCFWDSSTYRFKECVRMDRPACNLALASDYNNITRRLVDHPTRRGSSPEGQTLPMTSSSSIDRPPVISPLNRFSIFQANGRGSSLYLSP